MLYFLIVGSRSHTKTVIGGLRLLICFHALHIIFPALYYFNIIFTKMCFAEFENVRILKKKNDFRSYFYELLLGLLALFFFISPQGML